VRLATIAVDGRPAACRLDGDALVEVGFPDVGQLFAAGPDWRQRAAAAAGPAHPAAGATFLPVVPRPAKVICVGLNYRSHILELGRDLPEYPTLFAKFARTLIGAYDDIAMSPVSAQMDWEAELAFVVDRPLRAAGAKAAGEAIGGYTVLNDVTARDWQYRTTEFLQGKAFEGTTPVGPFLVTPDEVDNAADLRIGCEVDGQIVQDARTADLLFGPGELAAYVSQFVTLDPGDIISTGTPDGIGAARQPPVFLREGQVVRTFIEGVGECRNTCRRLAWPRND
jgi:acylpyruvate hydrolase